MNISSFILLNLFYKNENMHFFLKYACKFMLLLLFLTFLYMNSGCAVQKHHQKAVPCPCEKRRHK